MLTLRGRKIVSAIINDRELRSQVVDVDDHRSYYSIELIVEQILDELSSSWYRFPFQPILKAKLPLDNDKAGQETSSSISQRVISRAQRPVLHIRAIARCVPMSRM